MKASKQKLYCYVDENGQDTKGDIFIVSVVVTSKERDELLSLCEDIEEKSGKAVHFKEPKEYTTLIYVDGLAKTKRQEYGSELRKLGVPTRKVQGVTKDENNSLTRLADAIAGFVRDVLEERGEDMEKLFKQATRAESLVEV